MLRINPVLIAVAMLVGCTKSEVPAELKYNGVTYDLLDSVAPAPEELGTSTEALSAPQEPALTVTGAVGPGIEKMSRDELAAALRPVIGHPNGGIYIAREPNWAAADLVLSSDRTPRDVDPVLKPRGKDDELGHTQDALTGIIGADGRVLANTSAHPHTAIAQLLITRGGSTVLCSGSYIGPWTLVTAAHCLVGTDGAQASRIEFRPGRQGSSIPHQFLCRNDDSATNNNILWAVPSAFVANPGGAHNFDYAVIDTYPCHPAPSWFAGYAVWPNDATYSAYGYPGEAPCPGASGGVNFQCGMSGPAYDTDGWILETEHIDQGKGQSGGPWFRQVSGVTRVMGTAWAYREYFDLGRCGFDVCRRNAAHLIDDAFDAHIKAFSFDY